MKQNIQLAAIVMRDGRVLLVRPEGGAPWELPGGRFSDEHDDMDAAMDALLRGFGIEAPAVEEDFVETLFLPDGEGQIILNLWAPTEWTGEPAAQGGADLGWFPLDELQLLEMDARVRNGVLRVFGLGGGDDDDDLLAVMQRELGFDMEEAPDSVWSRLAGEPNTNVDRKLTSELAKELTSALRAEWSRPGLDQKTRTLAAMALAAALQRGVELRTHIEGAIDAGAAGREISETLRLVATYAGFPVAIEAARVMEQVFAERGLSA